jgi:hypothetical protein
VRLREAHFFPIILFIITKINNHRLLYQRFYQLSFSHTRLLASIQCVTTSRAVAEPLGCVPFHFQRSVTPLMSRPCGRRAEFTCPAAQVDTDPGSRLEWPFWRLRSAVEPVTALLGGVVRAPICDKPCGKHWRLPDAVRLQADIARAVRRSPPGRLMSVQGNPSPLVSPSPSFPYNPYHPHPPIIPPPHSL